jgi:hypothetical protein
MNHVPLEILALSTRMEHRVQVLDGPQMEHPGLVSVEVIAPPQMDGSQETRISQHRIQVLDGPQMEYPGIVSQHRVQAPGARMDGSQETRVSVEILLSPPMKHPGQVPGAVSTMSLLGLVCQV